MNIRRVIEEVRALALPIDILVVDDASEDSTPEVARRAGAIVLQLGDNLGYGGAVQAGFRYAIERGYTSAVQLDGDGQHDPAGIPPLLEALNQPETDIVLGSRYLGTMEYQTSWPRKLGRVFFQVVLRVLTGRQYTDPISGYQALKKPVLEFFAAGNYPTDYPDADTLLTLHYAGFRICEAPVKMRARMGGASMHTGLSLLYYVLKMVLSIFIVFLRRRQIGRAASPGAP